jgi:multicomponent K+:H+ antiporter subunit E
VLSGAIFVLWVLLAQSADAASLVFAGLVAVGAPLVTAPLRPTPVRMRRPGVILRLFARVFWDSLRSNVRVGASILRGQRDPSRSSSFVRIPLDVRDPNALAVLSMIVTGVPGTAWAELSSDRSVLMLHVLALGDEAEVIDMIKTRYERPLMEIFE